MLRVYAISLSLLYSVLFFTSASQAEEKLHLSGVAVYTDTARDIYLAGLHSPAGTPSSASPAGPMAMEYRIETRRISTRGYFGTLLLQAEMGSGQRAPESVIAMIERIKGRMQGSFVRGDSIVFHRGQASTTLFLLNNTPLLEVPGTEAFDFFLQGWLGDNASSLLRAPLMAQNMNPELHDRFRALLPDQPRIEAVAAWLDDPASDEKSPSAIETAAMLTPVPEQAKPEVIAKAAPATAAPGVASAEPPEQQAVQTAEVLPAPEPPAEPDTHAVEPLPAPETRERIAQNIDDREYQRQLSQYMAQTINKVFSNVEYPRRALKRGQQGQVTLVAQVSGSGDLQDVVLQASSGHDILDKAAVRAVEDAAPFPELSSAAREEFLSATGDAYELSIPISFSMAASRGR